MNTNWKYILVGIAILVLCLLASAAPALATPQRQGCMAIDVATKQLKDNHGETAAFLGVSRSEHLIMVFLNAESGTWTVGKVMTQKRGSICILDAGTSGYIQTVEEAEGDTDG